jgi:hypothetical protein
MRRTKSSGRTNNAKTKTAVGAAYSQPVNARRWPRPRPSRRRGGVERALDAGRVGAAGLAMLITTSRGGE